MAGIRRILIVDDEPPIRALLADILRSEGYAVCEAGHGLDALHEVSLERPDAILLDVNMPLMDGPTFARMCHAMNPLRPIPILLVSASAKLWLTAEHLRRFGVRGFVSKPFDLSILVDAVAGVVEPARALAAAV